MRKAMTSSTVSHHDPDTLILKPSRGWAALNLRDLWRYRELAFFLTWRDIKVRYKQTLLGASWAILQPFIQMVIFNFLFGDLADISTGNIPRPIFTFAALLPWNLFSTALNEASRSLVSNRNMITKIYFPKLLVPLSSILGGTVDFAIAFVILLGMMAYYRMGLSPEAWAVPLFLLLALATAFGVGLWLSAWNLHYRDVRFILPLLTQIWMLATPIAYPLSEVPEQWQLLYSANPMVAVVEGFRWALLGGEALPSDSLWLSGSVAIVLLITGLFYFRRMERTFADIV